MYCRAIRNDILRSKVFILTIMIDEQSESHFRRRTNRSSVLDGHL